MNTIRSDLAEYQTERIMSAELAAIPLPDLRGKSVLDVGCGHGYWSWLVADKGAEKVVGLDRGRNVAGVGETNLVALNNELRESNEVYREVCSFRQINLGKQWHEFGQFDVVLMLSLYHHVFENVGDHAPIWYWLWRHTKPDGVLLWKSPVDRTDSAQVAADLRRAGFRQLSRFASFVHRNVSEDKYPPYARERILAAADEWFEVREVGVARGDPTRAVWQCLPRPAPQSFVAEFSGVVSDGVGGATKAYAYHDGRRIGEVASVMGWTPYPGTLNVWAKKKFDWGKGYYRAPILDVIDRHDKRGFDQEWKPRQARFYPVTISGVEATAVRYEGAKYKRNFIELIAPMRLRDRLKSDQVKVCRR